MLMQYTYFFSERQKTELLWSRCVNTKGLPGHNMPCDLYMEHLNRRLKGMIRGMGGNVKPKTIEKAAKTIGPVSRVCSVFERQTMSTKQPSDRHSYPCIYEKRPSSSASSTHGRESIRSPFEKESPYV